MGLENEGEYTIASKAIQKIFYIDDFAKLVERSEEAIKDLGKLQARFVKWIRSNEAATEAVSEDLKSISKTKQFEIEPNPGDLLCLDYNKVLLMIALKCAKVPTKKKLKQS